MENLEIIYDDEDVIGKVLDVKKLFVFQLAKDLQDKEIALEDKINQINLVQELLEKLEEESERTIIKVSFNPMGTFNVYYIQGWEE